MFTRLALFLVTGGLGLVADQLSKIWARASLLPGQEVKVLGSFWSWDLSYNTGSAFGLFNTMAAAKYFLTAIAIAAAIFITYYVVRKADLRPWATFALGLIASGALGNAIDRVLYGKVTDFVLWQASFYRHPQFNVADAWLVVGIIILIIDPGSRTKAATA